MRPSSLPLLLLVAVLVAGFGIWQLGGAAALLRNLGWVGQQVAGSRAAEPVRRATDHATRTLEAGAATALPSLNGQALKGSPAGVHKCRIKGELVYTDAPCPAGADRQQVGGGSVTVVSAPRVAPAVEEAPSAPEEDLRAKRMEAIIGR